MRLAGREGEMDRQAIGVHDRVNLARQASSRATHVLVIVVRDTGSVLMHAHDGGIDHLHRPVVTVSQRIHDLVPDPSLPPTSEAIVASGAGTIGFRQVAPGSTQAQDPKDTVQDAPVVNTGNAARLVRKERPDGSPFKVRESYRMIRGSGLGA